jgi:pimeloyl-ACP methyl ester carboxylesterase
VIERLEVGVRGLGFQALATGPPTGELVLLLHGFPQTSACWTATMEALAASGCWAFALDQRGYSSRARPGQVQAYRTAELVADVVAVADRLGAGRVHLVGHDWGGVVAWNLAGRHPERVTTLTVVSTPHPKAFTRALWSSDQLLRSAYIGFFRTPRLPELLLGAQQQRGLRFLLAGSGLDREWIDIYTDALGQPGALAAALAWYRAATPLSAWAPQVVVPTLYVWGSRDPALGPTAARTTGRWVTGPYRFEVIPGAGHWLPEQHPKQLASLLLAQLQGAGVPSGGFGRDG